MDFYLQRLHDRLNGAIAGMTAVDRLCHPAGKWCTAEILEHLYLTYTGTAKGFEKCLAAGKPMATVSTLKQRIAAFVVLGIGKLPSGREAPTNTRPRGLAPDTVATDIFPRITAMDEAIRRCEQAYGNVKLLDHPILGPLTGGEWRKFHLVHGQHHIKQILQLRGGLVRNGA
jgi:Protein of unknown function (DUF1569)